MKTSHNKLKPTNIAPKFQGNLTVLHAWLGNKPSTVTNGENFQPVTHSDILSRGFLDSLG